ncbi:MAG: GNAT family N-acetyltransferase, partial [Deltaproteobacteria bacterium]|nr:GNAT family N-acetyltransferase [Deltaproteobacteria bacterium]
MAFELKEMLLTSDAARLLIGELNAETLGKYPEPGATHFRLDEEEVVPGTGLFLVAYDDGAPVGCGAIRKIEPHVAEI